MSCQDCETCAEARRWRDYPPAYQVQLRALLALMDQYRGRRYEVRLLRGGELQVAEVSRRAVLGRGAGGSKSITHVIAWYTRSKSDTQPLPEAQALPVASVHGGAHRHRLFLCPSRE